MQGIRIAFTTASLAFMLVAPSAFAHGEEPAAGPISPAVRAVLGDDVDLLADGLYQVHVPGPDLITHGPDPALEAKQGNAPPPDPNQPQRAPACSPDQSYQQVLYARRPSEPALDAATRDHIRAVIRHMDALLHEASLAGSGGAIQADYKVLCDASGNIDVGEFTVPSPAGNESGVKTYESVVTAAIDAGFNDRRVDYTIFFSQASGDNTCGVGSFRRDEQPGIDNANNNPGGGIPPGYALTYNGCWDSVTTMHENGHNQGAVQRGAPHATDGGHCWDESDVMCYRDSPDSHPIENRCATIHFDCGSDNPAADGNDYFDSAPEPGEYLETHWNIGSPVNRFIAFSGASGNQLSPAYQASASIPTRRPVCRRSSRALGAKGRARRSSRAARRRAHGRQRCRAK